MLGMLLLFIIFLFLVLVLVLVLVLYMYSYLFTAHLTHGGVHITLELEDPLCSQSFALSRPVTFSNPGCTSRSTPRTRFG